MRTSKLGRSVKKLRLTFGDLVAAAYDAVGSGPRAAERVVEILSAVPELEPRLVIVRGR